MQPNLAKILTFLCEFFKLIAMEGNKRKHSESSEDESYIGPMLPPHLTKARKATAESKTSDNVIGPVLPSHLMKDKKDNYSEDSSSDSEDDIGPSLPKESNVSIGPALPPGFSKRRDDTEDKISSIGPAVPPGLRQPTGNHGDSSSDDEQGNAGIGPRLPPGFKKAVVEEDEEDSFGPALPPHLMQQASSSSNDLNVIGPMTSEMMTGDASESVAAEFEQRAQRMKSKLTEQPDEGPKQRESWMTEVPSGMRKDIGLTARTFSRRQVTDADKDSSVWTDTPADKERKRKEAERRGGERMEAISTSEFIKDKEYEKAIHKHNKAKRKESLMEMHEKKQKKKKKKEREKEKNKPKQREAFDREKDLQVNRFDEAQRKSIIKKSQLLNTRFNHGGSTSSFL